MSNLMVGDCNLETGWRSQALTEGWYKGKGTISRPEIQGGMRQGVRNIKLRCCLAYEKKEPWRRGAK